MKLKRRRGRSPLQRKARRGFRSPRWPSTGPDDRRASKVAGGIVAAEGAQAEPLERWFCEDGDARTDDPIGEQVLAFIREHGALSVVTADRIIGCPHEEGVDYPEGQVCPRCPFWAHRDRWSGEVIR
jgi:hypothetical protein